MLIYSDLKSSSGLTIQSLKSKAVFNNNTFANTSSNSVIGALSLDVSSLTFTNCTFDNNIYYGMELSNNEIFSLNIGGFIAAKVDTISLTDTHFKKTFSSQGAIQIKSNQNKLEVSILKCTFKEIFAFSSSGSVLNVDSSQSILQMVIQESTFENIVQITNQYTYQKLKAVIYIEKDYSFQNDLNFVQFDQVDITNVITQFIEQKQNYFFNSFQSSFNSFFFIGSIINVQAQQFNIKSDRKYKELIEFLQYIEQFQHQKLQFNDKDKLKEQIMHSPIFYLEEGEISLQNITYYGNREEVTNITNKFSQNNIHENLFKYKKTLIVATQSTVRISNLSAINLLVTKFIDVKDSEKVELKQLFFERVEQLLIKDLLTSNLEKIGQSAIINLKKIQNISIENLEIYCDQNQLSQQSQQNQINNEQQQLHCLGQVIFIQESQFDIKNSIIHNYVSPIHNGTAISILNPNNSCTIKNNRFYYLKTSGYGGAIYIQMTNQGFDFKDYFYNYIQDSKQILNINLEGNTFQFNQAEKGGCIFFENLLDITDRIKFQISQNKFYNNTSRLGSSLYYQNIVPYIETNNKFKYNSDDISKSTIFSTPHLIKLVQTDEIKQILNFNSSLHWNDKNSEYIADIIIASGQKLPALKFQFYFIHDFSQEINLVHLDLIQTDIPIQEYINIELSYDPSQQNSNLANPLSPFMFFLRNKDEIKYEKEGNYIEFSNLQLLGVFNQSITLQVSSPLIMHENKRLNQIEKNIKFKINVFFRQCNKYEITTKTDFLPSEMSNQIMQCYKCLDNTFARDGSVCSECPQGAVCKQEHEIQISPGYWRKSLSSYEIIQCFNELGNCRGGNSFGNQLCQEGYVGALCEECDLFAEVWPHSYTRQGNFKCVRCNKQGFSYFLIILSHILTLIVAISSIVSNSESIKIKTIKAIYKQQRKSNKPNRSANNLDQYNKQDIKQIQSGANLKILASYFSLMSCMSNFKFSLPRIIPEVSGVVGSPIAISMNAIDCLLVKMPITNKFPYIYFSFILKLIFPFIVFTAIITLLFIWNCVHKYKFQTHYFYTTFLFLYIFLQGDLVYEAINLIACRNIAGEKYLLANVNYQCNSDNHRFEFGLVYPSFIILSLLFPICLLINLIRNKQQLRKIRYQLRWGILYHEYKDDCFYWEFIKISEKLFIIISISLFNQAQNIQLGVLIIILILYMLYLYKMKPFMLKKDNSMEFLSSFTILLTIILISISIQKQIQNYQYFITISFIIAINALFVLFISTKIYVEQYELFKQKKPMILIKCPQIAKFLNYLSEKLQNGWRGEQSANNSQKNLSLNANKPEKENFQENKQKKVLVVQDSSINQYNYPYKNKTQQDSNNISENINNQFNSLSQDKSKIGFFNRDECIEEFNSFGKSSYKNKKENKIVSASSIDSCNLEMVDVNEKKLNKAVPVSQFLARNQNVQSSQNNIISSYQKKNFSLSLNSQYQQSLQSTLENMKQRYFKRKQKSGVNFNQEMAKIKKVSTINNIIQNTSNLQTSQISSNLSVFTSNQDISSMQE
ncbi:transmembrane protein, putative (macronuclear) [Tetrahymena thermophila SB210]|uniref:Transmembrane protein, putative n=1 Tax=Tetrahymena thermophila (strain SB210) TaxID=312017 RepID=Q22MX3_TETTS|nr:transmembrane protein, putative [Tetrahymena thermophila SB210]EAR86425.2 transmembrane protein, putative [Tetrahymena thermophila SB210]|eukprot:XP_976897.2 transmembrane protein, putative [Tetrahymena thermophila SB210]